MKKTHNDLVSEFKVIHENISQMACWALSVNSTQQKQAQGG